MPDTDLIPDRVSFCARNVQNDLSQSQVSINTSEKQYNFLQKPSQPHNKSTQETEYHKMLEAFNRSLSQVIEVNQQLYSTFKIPPANVVPIKIRDGMTQTTPNQSFVNNASGNSKYSEDFERSDAQNSRVSPSSEGSGSTGSTPRKNSKSRTTSEAATTATAATTTASGSSPDDSPSKSQSSDSRSFSLSDSHNTNPPMPEEYLPSFEESLRRQKLDQSRDPTPKPEKVNSSPSIETQISDGAEVEGNALRGGLNRPKSVESISFKISENSDVSNRLNPEVGDGNGKVEFIKAVTSSSSCSELEALDPAESISEKDIQANDTTMGSDIFAVFNRTDLEISVMSTTMSEANLSYSSIGMVSSLTVKMTFPNLNNLFFYFSTTY